MKKLLIYLLLCCSFMGSQAAIQRSVSFAKADVQVGETVVNGVTYSTISMEGWKESVGANNYLVPAKFLSFSVPYNAENISVSASSVSTYFDVTLPHPLAKETLNGEEAGGIMFSRRCNAPTVETMTVEGRTWWYEIDQVYSGTSVARSEIGLTINGTKEIDGKTWHVIKLRLGANISSDGKIQPFCSDNPVALIRQEGKEVFAMVDATCTTDLECIFSSLCPPQLYNTPTLIYSYGNVGDMFTIYEGGYFPITYKVVEKIDATASTYAFYNCRFVEENGNGLQFEIGEGLGITSIGNGEEYGFNELFFAPFGVALSGMRKYETPKLRYVTDGDENTVIYTGKGGFRLWDNYNGVESVITDGESDSAAEVRYYNLQGQPVSDPRPGGMYIRMDGGRATKVII